VASIFIFGATIERTSPPFASTAVTSRAYLMLLTKSSCCFFHSALSLPGDLSGEALAAGFRPFGATYISSVARWDSALNLGRYFYVFAQIASCFSTRSSPNFLPQSEQGTSPSGPSDSANSGGACYRAGYFAPGPRFAAIGYSSNSTGA
jgi:hypothetical protein